MKERILACVTVIVMISMLMIGCTSVSSTDTVLDRIDNMFVSVGRSDYINVDIVYDSETKVMYAISCEPYNRGTMTLLVNKDGSPKLWQE